MEVGMDFLDPMLEQKALRLLTTVQTVTLCWGKCNNFGVTKEQLIDSFR